MRAGYLRYSGLQEFDRTMQHLEFKLNSCTISACILFIVEFKNLERTI